MSNPRTLGIEEPLEMDDARRASRKLAELRRGAEALHEEAVTKAADAERDYRKELSKAHLSAEGSTAAQREAAARAACADAAYLRDLSAGMVRVAQERLRGLEGERSMLKSLIDLSGRLLDRIEPPVSGSTYGRRGA
jgi:hypothetical protein